MAEYEISRTTGCCNVSGRPLTEGETFHTVLFETPDGFERRDISEECWEGLPEGAFCHFKTRLPKKDEPKKTFVDDDVLVTFFLRLADSEEPLKQQFRFVLSLILMRKRLLKYHRTLHEDGREYWEMRMVRDKRLHKVFNPSLDETQIGALTGELASVLSGDVPDQATDGESEPVQDRPAEAEPAQDKSAEAEPAAAGPVDGGEPQS